MAEPVSLTTAKAHLKVLDTSEDALIASYIAAAREWVENYTGHILVQRQMVQAFDRFTAYLQLHQRPIVTVNSIAYTDSNGAAQTIASFVVADGRYPLRIYPAYNDWWPSFRANTLVEVTFTAGYAPGEEPQVLISALLIKLELLEDRGRSAPEVTKAREMALHSLCDQFRVPGL